mgnify:CR=1 FL=1
MLDGWVHYAVTKARIYLNTNLPSRQQQALEACISDAVSYVSMFLKAQQHAEAPLLFNGFIAHASMFVYESYRCVATLFPDVIDIISPSYAELIRKSRHRAKLLDDTNKTIEEVTAELLAIAERQRDFFLAPHCGFFAPLKRALQPDMGISICDNHIFTTTHATIYAFGDNGISDQGSFEFGKTIGAYSATLLNLFQIEIPSPAAPLRLTGNIEMRDIKHEALYNRGPLGVNRLDFSTGLILILANLNFVIYVLSKLLPPNDHALFRMKFITAFHANTSIKSMQDRLMADKTVSSKVKDFFGNALGNKDSRWLRKRKHLRNLITHYLPNETVISELLEGTSRIETIEHYGGGLTFDEMNTLLDRNIAHLSGLLEKNYDLAGDPFWLGKVR